MVAPVPPLVAVAGVECHGASFGVSADVKCYNIKVEEGEWSGTWDRGEGRGRSSCVCVQMSAHKCAYTRAHTHGHEHTPADIFDTREH